jgi:hypothetical protein
MAYPFSLRVSLTLSENSSPTLDSASTTRAFDPLTFQKPLRRSWIELLFNGYRIHNPGSDNKLNAARVRMMNRRQEDFLDQAVQITSENGYERGVFSYSFSAGGQVTAINTTNDSVDQDTWEELVDLASSYGFTLREAA